MDDSLRDPVAIARTLLAAVAALHTRGYHGVRIRPGMSPSGTAWRCALLAKAEEAPFLRYSSSSRDQLEGGLTIGADPDRLATDLERTRAVLASTRIEDPAYVAWFAAMLAATAPRSVPIAYDDSDDDFTAHWGTSPSGGVIPLPPLPRPPRPRPAPL